MEEAGEEAETEVVADTTAEGSVKEEVGTEAEVSVKKAAGTTVAQAARSAVAMVVEPAKEGSPAERRTWRRLRGP